MQSFDGSHSLTSAVFKTQDKWEIRWDSSSRVRITLLTPDGTVRQEIAYRNYLKTELDSVASRITDLEH